MQLLWFVLIFGVESGNYPATARGPSGVVTEACGVLSVSGGVCSTCGGVNASHGGDGTGHGGGGHDAADVLRVTALATGVAFSYAAWAAGDVTGTMIWIALVIEDTGSSSCWTPKGLARREGGIVIVWPTTRRAGFSVSTASATESAATFICGASAACSSWSFAAFLPLRVDASCGEEGIAFFEVQIGNLQ